MCVSHNMWENELLGEGLGRLSAIFVFSVREYKKKCLFMR